MQKKGVWIMIHLESLILSTCECKALSERDSCMRILEMHVEALHGTIRAVGTKIIPRSAQILFVIQTAFAMLLNAHSSDHEPNQKADRDPKRLSERDSLHCERALCLIGPSSEK